MLTPLAAQTRALAYTPLIAEAALLLALCLELAGDYDGAERAIFEALSEAEAAGHEPVEPEAAIRLLRIVGLRGPVAASPAARITDARSADDTAASTACTTSTPVRATRPIGNGTREEIVAEPYSSSEQGLASSSEPDG